MPERDAIVITDPAVLKAFFDPLRYRIIKLLNPPKAVRELAEELDVPAGRLYYHVDLLVQRGLVKVVEERIVGTNVERVYAPAAVRFELTEELADSPVALRTAMTHFDELFDDYRRILGRELPGRRGSRVSHVLDARLEIPAYKAKVFADQVKKLVEELKADGGKGKRYAVLFVLASDDEEPGRDQR